MCADTCVPLQTLINQKFGSLRPYWPTVDPQSTHRGLTGRLEVPKIQKIFMASRTTRKKCTSKVVGFIARKPTPGDLAFQPSPKIHPRLSDFSLLLVQKVSFLEILIPSLIFLLFSHESAWARISLVTTSCWESSNKLKSKSKVGNGQVTPHLRHFVARLRFLVR